MKPDEFLKTIYLGDRGCKAVVLDGWKNEVKIQIDLISRKRSETWNFYSAEDVEDGFLVFEEVDHVSFDPPGRIGDSRGNNMIEPLGGRTVPGQNPVDTHTLYPNGSNYHRLNPQGHGPRKTPHAHGHLEGSGPYTSGQGPSLDVLGNIVPWNSPDAHWPMR